MEQKALYNNYEDDISGFQGKEFNSTSENSKETYNDHLKLNASPGKFFEVSFESSVNAEISKHNTSSIRKNHTNIQDGPRPTIMEKLKVESSLSIYCVTWNLFGKSASYEEISSLLPEKKYDIYAIGSEECMRSIFKSFFYSDKTHWEKMIM
jgi:hypothetical protein